MCLALAILAPPVLGGALQDIPPGGNVFLGEQGLNLTAIPAGTTLAWYTGSQVVGRSAPAATITIGNNASFYVAPSDFATRTGNWYIGDSTEVGFVVTEPSQSVSVYGQKSQKDVTNKTVSSGEFLTFRVETTMNVVPAQRPGAAGFLTLRVMSPDGMVYTQLYQDDSTILNLTGLAPDAMPWYWVPLEEKSEEGWSTGFRGPENNIVYHTGRYIFWTESNLNGMKENYKDASGNDFTGKTVSAVHSVTTSIDHVTIGASNSSVVRGNRFTVTITGKADSAYYLWVEGTKSMSGMAGDQPPSIVLLQEGVRMDPKDGPWPIGKYVFQGSKKTTIQQDVAQGYGHANVNGVVYYASVTLSGNGNRTVAFSTTKDTYSDKYSIRVERPEPYDPPASDTNPERTFKTARVDVTVEKGGVEMADQPPGPTPGTRTYYLGEEITLTGTNSVTDFTYLFITGPNLPAGGGQMTDPRKPVSWDDPDSFTYVEVINGSWEYTWQTARLNIDSGSYTIFAVSDAYNRSRLEDNGDCDSSDPDCNSGPLYSTVSVIIRKPFISAQASPPIVASGDRLFIRGIAAGQPEEGVVVWILGKNKVICQVPGVNTDGTFELEVPGGQTAEMAPGQYFVIVQHPMYNQVFDVWPASSVAGYNNQDLVVGSYPVSGNTLFKLQGDGSLLGPDAADALVQAINNPGIDDIYAKLEFLVEVPVITILPVDEKQVGDTFSLAGTTNLAVNDMVLVEVISSAFKPTTKTEGNEFSGTSGTAMVREGAGGRNRWVFQVNTSAFRPGEYIVQVSGITVDAEASTLFNVAPFNPATHRPVVPDEETPGASGPVDNDLTPGNTTTGEEDIMDDSPDISISAKSSRLARVIESRPPTVTVPVATSAPAVLRTAMITPVRTTAQTSRPTIQPGFCALVALIGLFVAAFHLVRKY